MNAIVGNYSLMAALLACAIAVVSALGAARFMTPAWHRATRWSYAAFTAMLLLASVALSIALGQSDFSLAYVASYTEQALPMGYKLSAFWAGQEGSLLFWGVTLAVMALIFVIANRSVETRPHAVSLLVLAGVCGFFVALLLLAANPFKVLAVVPADGKGLNPMLQNIGMLAHPPTLFVGYAGYTIPFALALGALLTGRINNEWIVAARRWSLVSWVFLTVGIVLGAQWAYVELGWGGYWAWDPVENASLLPWLTGTALVHAMIVQKDRSMFRVWNLVLAIMTFMLCIFGTYLTRSGVIESVHAFPKSLISTFFLAFLVIVTLFCAVLVLTRWFKMKQQPTLEAMVSKEGAILVGNTMLVFMMGLTLVGTIFPLISGLAAGNSVAVTQNFYNKSVLPLAILMLLMMGVAPMLAYGSTKIAELVRRLRIPLLITIVVVAIVAVTHQKGTLAENIARDLWTLFATFAITMTVTGIAADFIRVVMSRRRAGERGFIRPAWAAIDANHRRYGGHMCHLGMAMIVAGVLGSSLYVVKENHTLTEGQTVTVDDYTITLDRIQPAVGPNYEGLEAVVQVTDPSGRTSEMHPQIRKYFKSTQNNAEVAFQTGLREDLYISLLGVERDNAAAIQVVVNPLVLWIWFGGIAMTLGGFWCMFPTFGAGRRDLVEQDAARAPDEVMV